MTNPTDLRVEAAARAICSRYRFNPDEMSSKLMDYRVLEKNWEKYKEIAQVAIKAADEAAWQPIETAPTGANGVAWMQLAKVDGEETFTWSGMHCRGKFYAAGVFHKGGDVPYEFRQQEVQPTHWRPEQAPPKTL